MVERIVDTFSAVLPRPITEAVFILGPDFGQEVRDTLTDICQRHGAKAHFKVQDVALGTAHAVGCAEEHLEGEGIMVFADTLFYMDPGVDLDDADVVAWVKHVDDPSRFGVAVREGDRIVELVEKPQVLISTEALIGIYYCKEFKELGAAIQYLFDNNITGVGDEYQLTDAFDRMLKQDKVFKTASVTEWLDCGTIDALAETTSFILDYEKHTAQADGVTIHQPVYLGEGATVTTGEIGPHVSIEAGASIADSRISNSVVFSKADIRNCTLEDSFVGHHAQVQDFKGSLNIGDHSEVKGSS